MEQAPSFNEYIYRAIIDNWNSDALTDYQGATLQYHDVARKIEKLHILFENCDVKKGDKVAICGRNSSHWAVAFLATLTYGAVAVPILHEFNAEQIHNIVNHSEAKLLFVGDYVVKTIDADAMPHLEGIINLPDFSLHTSRSEKLTYAREHLNYMFGTKYPRAFRAEHVKYHHDEPDELALINYTSGTTGFSKGAMLPYRALWGNLDFCMKRLPVKANDTMLSILPMAHMYGLAIEFIYGFCRGCHLFFLTRLPSPAIIADAFATVRPAIVIAVPLIVEKIIRKRVFPKIQTNGMRLLLQMPVVSKKVKEKICEQVYQAFGGRAYEIIVGGAALSREVEQFLVPAEGMDVKEHRTRCVGHIGAMHGASGKLPDEPAVNGTEAQAALAGKVTGILHILKDPADFGAAEIRVDEKAGLVLDLFRQAKGLERITVLRGTAVLPHYGIVHRLAGLGVPHNGGLTLVGNAYGCNFGWIDAAFGHDVQHNAGLAFPNFFGVMLHPTGTGEMLGKLLLAYGYGSAVVIKNDGTGTTCSLIECKNILFHNCLSQI